MYDCWSVVEYLPDSVRFLSSKGRMIYAAIVMSLWYIPNSNKSVPTVWLSECVYYYVITSDRFQIHRIILLLRQIHQSYTTKSVAWVLGVRDKLYELRAALVGGLLKPDLFLFLELSSGLSWCTRPRFSCDTLMWCDVLAYSRSLSENAWMQTINLVTN